MSDLYGAMDRLQREVEDYERGERAMERALDRADQQAADAQRENAALRLDLKIARKIAREEIIFALRDQERYEAWTADEIEALKRGELDPDKAYWPDWKYGQRFADYLESLSWQ